MSAAARTLIPLLLLVLASCDLGSDRVEPVAIPDASEVVYVRVWQADVEHRIADRAAIGRIVAIIGSDDLVWRKADMTFPTPDARVSFRLRTNEELFVTFVGANWIGDPPAAVAMIDDADMQTLRKALALN